MKTVKEEQKLKNRHYYLEHLEQITKQRQRYYQEHKEEISNQKRQYRSEHKQAIREYRKCWYEEHRKGEIEKAKRKQFKMKKEVLSHYSNASYPVCVRCKMEDIDVLTIDHINGGGCKHRQSLVSSRGSNFYRWLANNNYPEGYQVLCANCNIKKRIREDILGIRGKYSGKNS